MKNKSALYIVLLLLLPALLLAGCGQATPSEAGSSLQTAVAEASAKLTTQGVVSEASAQQTTQAVVSEASAQETAAMADEELRAEQLQEGDLLDVLQNTLAQVYAQVNPSVVNIQVTVQSGVQSNGMPSFPGMPSTPDQEAPEQEGLGSGFVWDTDGHIVTNNHVVEDATEITVTFYDGTSVPAKVVGTDLNSDLAVIKLDVPADELHPIEVADSTAISVGQLAAAIGNPYGLEGTMTVGFISALGRSLAVNAYSNTTSYTIPDIIQTDAPINPGNSGGVLVDDEGRLIGVPTAIESTTGSNSGIGFAVPSAIVQKVVPALIDGGAVEYSWLGITGTTLTTDLAEAMGLDRNQHGALVIDVTSGGPADKAGLRGSDWRADPNGEQVEVGGDVIVAIQNQPVSEFDDLVSYLVGSTSAGDEITLTILRDGEEQAIEVILAARPETQGPLNQTLP
jgi:serine protease Do